MNTESTVTRLTISIWFFIGLSLLVNGILILGAGVYEMVQPPPVDARVVLFQYHAGVWWGALLAVLGGFYCWHFAPKRVAN
jgi:FtsH-binding integral membrane protein